MNPCDEIYSRVSYVCASSNYSLNLKVIAEFPWQNLFSNNMFLRPTNEEINNFHSDWTILAFLGILAEPKEHGTRQGNFCAINFTKKIIFIGEAGYNGEIKKGILTVLNFTV